jgi:hypothetical protein
MNEDRVVSLRRTGAIDDPLELADIDRCTSRPNIRAQGLLEPVKPMHPVDAWRMIRRRPADLGARVRIGRHTLRATGITVYLEAGAR